MVRRQINEWPCGTCKKNCVNSCLFCVVCEKWFHSDCENVSKETLSQLSEIPEDNISVLCRCDDGKFDLLMGIIYTVNVYSSHSHKMGTIWILTCRQCFMFNGKENIDNILVFACFIIFNFILSVTDLLSRFTFGKI